jgi:hypothetical protein
LIEWARSAERYLLVHDQILGGSHRDEHAVQVVHHRRYRTSIGLA